MSNTIEGFHGRSAMHEDALNFMLKVLPEQGRVLEIGTLDGATCAFWASHRPDVNFLSVDPFRGAHGTGPGVFNMWALNGANRENMNLFYGTFAELAKFTPCQFDLIFVDGDHSEEGTYADCELADAYLQPWGTLCVHDYDRRSLPHLKGVSDAVDQFLLETDFEIVDQCRSIVVLRR